MGIKLSNNANATLAASITSSATSITVTSGQGARFPTLSAGDYFYATLIDTSNNLEIVKCTARSTDVLTVVRAQESTTARAYSAGDRLEVRLTAQTFTDAMNQVLVASVCDQANTSTGYFDLPAGTTAQRPASPHSGTTRFNTTLGYPEWYDPASATWVPYSEGVPYTIQYLVIAGGGGGGYRYGGGGAGGYRTNVTGETSGGGASAEAAVNVTAGAQYTITVGAGGSGTSAGGVYGTNGSASSIISSSGSSLSITSVGGGAGGTGSGISSQSYGLSGGSGGGSTGDGNGLGSITGGAGTTGQGYAGGAAWDQSGNNSGGGGGGAGQVGGSATSSSSLMAGGNGVSSSITGTATTRGGGGAPARQTPSTAGTAGTGGGGAAGGGAGTANTGGGGGCGRDSTSGAGGSGVVIIRYLGAQRGTGGTVTSSGGYTIHTFTSSGTFIA